MRRLINKIKQWHCGFSKGHAIGKDWGYGGGNMADVWCSRCDKRMSIPVTEAMSQANAKFARGLVGRRYDSQEEMLEDFFRHAPEGAQQPEERRKNEAAD